MKKSFDVIIIGAGPAGSFAAYNCARSGLKTLLLDKAKFPRYKTCGGGLVKRGFDIIPFDISEAVERDCYDITLFDQELGKEFTVKRDYPLVKMVMRDKFDNLIVKKSIEAGVNFVDEIDIIDISIFDQYNLVKTNSGEFESKFLIAADGVTGIASKFTIPKMDYYRTPALEYEIFTDKETFEKHSKVARFDFGVIPEGYGWVFPKKNHLSVGIASFNPKTKNVKEYLNQYLTSLNLSQFECEKHGFIIPLNTKWKSFHYKNVLFVGDTAALPDPITAEGISNALISGQIAAKSISEHLNEPHIVGKDYSSKLMKEVVNENRYAKLIASVFYKSPVVRKFLLTRNGHRLANLMTEVISGNRKYSSLVAKPINYLRLMKRRSSS